MRANDELRVQIMLYEVSNIKIWGLEQGEPVAKKAFEVLTRFPQKVERNGWREILTGEERKRGTGYAGMEGGRMVC